MHRRRPVRPHPVYHRNADLRGRDLERAAAAGDPRAQKALAMHRLRTGELEHAANILIESAPVLKKLKAKLARKLALELVRAKGLVYYVAIEEVYRDGVDSSYTLGSFLTKKAAEKLCAEAVIERAEFLGEDDLPRWQAMYERRRYGRIMEEWNDGIGESFEEPQFFVTKRNLVL
jgi:hypothetical protein